MAHPYFADDLLFDLPDVRGHDVDLEQLLLELQSSPVSTQQVRPRPQRRLACTLRRASRAAAPSARAADAPGRFLPSQELPLIGAPHHTEMEARSPSPSLNYQSTELGKDWTGE